jgi:tripartite-type tricarboxylate transporter receptor subunit TctC
MKHRHHLLVTSALALTTFFSTCMAQSSATPQSAGGYPNKLIRIVVPYAAGTPGDTMARLLAPSLSESMTANVVVENLPGASGTIGVARVTKSAPDGYTLLMAGDTALVLSGGAYGVNPPYQTLRDLAPISQLIITPNVLVVSNDVPARSVQELMALVRSQPDKFSYGSGGIGFSQHRAGELMSSMGKLDMVHVPSTTNAWPDLLSGRVQLMFGNIAQALPWIKEGKVRALAVTSSTRASALPDLPTVSESGLPGFEAVAWFGMLAPAGTPAPILRRLETELRKAMDTPAMKQRVAALGAMEGALSSAGFTQIIQNDIKRWAVKP